MEDFHQQFLIDSIKKLKNLENDLSDAETKADFEREEIFRTLHTIKGTAQTFGFAAAGQLAHELENLLSAQQSVTHENFQTLFVEGIKLLRKSLEQNNFAMPARFIEKIHRIIPANLKFQTTFEVYLPEIPAEILECLSQTEKISIDSSLKLGQNIYCFEVGFKTVSFADDLIECRKMLNRCGEIIATFPSGKFGAGDKIGFRMLLASSAEKARIEKIAEVYDAKITLEILPETFSNDLPGVISKAVAHGENLAAKLGKNIDFKVSCDKINIPDKTLKIVFDVLIHLVRNAVDHGISNGDGKIEINVNSESKGLKILVADDGSGINLDKLKAKAIEQNIISAGKNLTEQTTLDLAFQPELSTAEKVTEISGRGIGLNAVKTTVETSGGTISIKNQIGKGAMFQIFLPHLTNEEI